jgi:hypothetical protein
MTCGACGSGSPKTRLISNALRGEQFLVPGGAEGAFASRSARLAFSAWDIKESVCSSDRAKL